MKSTLIKTDKEGTSVSVEFENIGEGISGDYNANDPDDINLLRVTIYVAGRLGLYSAIDDASYCTQMPASCSMNVLEKALDMIMDTVFDDVIAGNSIKKTCEKISWISPESVKAGTWQREFGGEKPYFALTCLGNIVSLGVCKDFDEADDKSIEAGHDANWIGDVECFERWEKQMAEIKKGW